MIHKGKSLVVGKNNFLATNTKIENYEDFIVTSINLKHQVSQEIRKVVHFQFLSWPDYGVPDSAFSILSLLQKVREKEYELLKSQIGKLCVLVLKKFKLFMIHTYRQIKNIKVYFKLIRNSYFLH